MPNPDHTKQATPAPDEPAGVRAERFGTTAAIVFRAARLVLLALVPPGCAGIAVGASTVVLKLGDPSIHLVGLLAIWISTAIVSVAAIIAGTIEAREYNWQRMAPTADEHGRNEG